MKATESLLEYIIILDKNDNVGTALKYIPAGKYLLSEGTDAQIIDVSEPIKAGFKVSLGRIKKSQYIYKYGSIIGAATRDINPGDEVHIENIKSLVNNE